jgi:GntR family transcriptional regulator
MDGGALFVVQSILRLWLVVAGLLDPITVVTPLSASSPVSDELLSEVPQGVGVSAPSFSPLYQQIKGLILRGLQAGEWRPGEAIPSEIDLAARYKVSQGTVRKAIDELAAENLLMRRQGKGTFVSTHAEERVQYRFLRLTPDLPIQQEPSQREFLDCRRLKAPADVAKVLSLPLGGDVIEIRRVLSFSGRPVVLDDIWLPGHMFKGLTAERLSQYQGPMYGLFESEFGVRMIRAEEKLRAVLADESVAPLLKVAPGSPLLSVERLSRTYDDQPVELRRGLYLTDQHHYLNELS